MFVKIPFFINQRKRLGIERIKGGRTTLSYAEYCSHYYHSHLSIGAIGFISSRSQPPMYSTFCTGSGEINIYQADMNSEGITEARATAYLMQIMTSLLLVQISHSNYQQFLVIPLFHL